MKTSTAPDCGKLNAFQKVMLQWSSLHPYNAFHAFKIAGPLQADRLLAALRCSLERLGIGIAEISSDGSCYRHETDRDPSVETFDGGAEPLAVLHGYVSGALNQPFDRPQMKPFRLAAIRCGNAAHYVVLSYDHWIADSVAVRFLLRELFGQYLDLFPQESGFTPDLYPDTYRRVFRRSIGGAHLLPRVYRTLRDWNRNRSAWRVACWSNTEWMVDYRHFHTVPGTVARLREFARNNGATVHDVFLAAFSRSLQRIMPSRGKSAGLALGSIVDTRGVADIDLGGSFGAFLGYYLTRVHPEDGLGLADAVRQIAARTRPIKARHEYLDSLVNMQFINTIWPSLSQTARQHFLRKSLPMSGGLSNVVVRDTWMTANRHVFLDYLRGVSTGPTLPIVLSPTTFGDRLNVGVSYRLAGFSRTKVDALLELLKEQLENPEDNTRGRRLRRPASAPIEDLSGSLWAASESLTTVGSAPV